MDYIDDDLSNYLADVDILILTDKYRGVLDKAITVEEIQKTLKSMQPGKTPGPDGIPVE